MVLTVALLFLRDLRHDLSERRNQVVLADVYISVTGTCLEGSFLPNQCATKGHRRCLRQITQSTTSSSLAAFNQLSSLFRNPTKSLYHSVVVSQSFRPFSVLGEG